MYDTRCGAASEPEQALGVEVGDFLFIAEIDGHLL
jgi:hypothetical protein